MRTVNGDGVRPPSRRGSRGTLLVTPRHHPTSQGEYAGARAAATAGTGE
ncbi:MULTISPECIES: hypothetical protein [unclassified Streptomyces]|jgi:hypothetical protein|nr:hypothetical protein [Streptomyces sp. NBC_00228]